jgi:hypothetical protein
MNESLAAACNEFEQILLAGMLRCAGAGRVFTQPLDASDESGDAAQTDGRSSAYDELFIRALAGAVERAGGIGIAATLRSALGNRQR